MKKKSVIISNRIIKRSLLRNIFLSSLKRVGRKFLMLLKKEKYIQVGLFLKKKIKPSKYLLYKTLHFILSSEDKNKYNSLGKQAKKVLGFSDLFYSNKILIKQKIIPILLSKLQYNLYDKNCNILAFFKHLNIKNNNLLFLQFYDKITFNYLYFYNFYKNIKNNIFISLHNVLLNYYLYLNTFNISNVLLVLNDKSFNNTKCLQFIDNYIKYKNVLNVKSMRILDKYLIKNRMFRAGKFFYKFLQYMKHFTFHVYKNNMLYRKLQYTKFHSNKYNFKLITINNDKLSRLKGWFSIYNYIKKFTYLIHNQNKSKISLISHYMKKYNYFYCFIIKYFYKVLYNLKFMFIEKFNFKKIEFLKLVILYVYYNKWFKFKNFIKKIKNGKVKKRYVRRIFRFYDLRYVSFLLRIKTKMLNAKYLLGAKLGRLIKKRKSLNFYKFKNSIRVVNWLLKYRKFKSIKNPFMKWGKKRHRPINFNNKNNSKFNKLNKVFTAGKTKVLNLNYKKKIN